MSKESNTLSLDIFHTWVSYYDYYRGYFFFLYCHAIIQKIITRFSMLQPPHRNNTSTLALFTLCYLSATYNCMLAGLASVIVSVGA